jgi:uncharacterized membrane protein YdjX (TVP38/TMEM64 family)
LLGKVILTAIILGGLGYFWHTLGLEEILTRAKALPALAVIGTISIIPLFGFPVSWLHLIAGIRFDFTLGLLIVTLTGMCHHWLGWGLVRILPRRFFAEIEPWRDRLAGAGHRDATLLCCLLPGMPYTVQLYLLPILGVPLRLLIWLAAPLHAVRAVITLLLGDYGNELTPLRLAILVAYYTLLTIVSIVIIQHLRRTIAAGQSGRGERHAETGV